MAHRGEHIGRRGGARLRRAGLVCALTGSGLLLNAAPAAAGPVLLTAPTLDRSGRTLSTDNGAWIPANNSYTYGWQRCDTELSACAQVPGRTGRLYLLSTADIGMRIRSVVAAANELLGTTTATSAPTDAIAPSPPVNLTPPAISGSGTKLTSTLGVWSDPSPADVAYGRQWQRCSRAEAAACANVAGQTAPTYTLTEADADRFVRVVVAAEGLGTAFAASAPLGPIQPLARPGAGGGGGGGGSGGGRGGPVRKGNPKQVGAPRKLRPFPKVIVAGRLARGLTFVSGLVVRRGPKGATVVVSCRGRGCPRGRFRGRLNRSGALRLRRFQRIYGPGAVIEIHITARGAIGKFTRLRFRARSVPGRRDACLMPGARKPTRCP